MADKTVQKTILGIMMDPHSLCMLQDRRDEYGDIMLPKTLKTIEGVREIANSFGFEEGTAAAIAVMEELTVPCYGAVGEEFLRQIDPAYTKALYGRRLARRLFRELPEETMETICRGLESLIACTHHTPEEKIALMIKTGRIFADSLERRGVAIIFTNQYKYFIIDKSAEAGVLTDYIIPENDLPKRDKQEKLEAAMEHIRGKFGCRSSTEVTFAGNIVDTVLCPMLIGIGKFICRNGSIECKNENHKQKDCS